MSIKELNMVGPHHICVLYVATAGLQGPLMGSDEQEIVLLIYIIIDVVQNKVVGVQQYPIRPTAADINENILSEQLTSESVLTDELIKTAGRRIEDALREFETYCAGLHVDPHNPGFRLMTDGQLPLRQCLHPEAYRKDLDLAPYYCRFHDLRKEVTRYLGRTPDDVPQSVSEMLELLQLKPECENEFYKREAKDMVNIVQRLIAEGHTFDIPEVIQLTLEPGICSKDEEIDDNCVVKARGLPWQNSDQDIAKFFRGLNVAKGGVALCLSSAGRRNGEALVRFECREHRDLALRRHRHHIGDRYIEVYRATGADFVKVAGGASPEAHDFLSRGAHVIVRMRGLPYDCTPQQVLDFFASGDNPVHVFDGAEGVLFVRKPTGKATGDAFVLFAEESDAPKALSKHRHLIGKRYIELFRSTTAEVQQVLNNSMETTPKYPLVATVPPIPAAMATTFQLATPTGAVPQHVIMSGTRKDCVRLRGLPYEAQVEHILDFLGEYAKYILYQGVHMVYNAQGQPSGEAFIQMDSEQSAYQTAQNKHHRYMVYGKKQRYIEVFQCSGEDMNQILTGGLPPAPVSPAKVPPLLSPGMLVTPPATAAAPPPAPPPQTLVTTAAPPTNTLWDGGHMLLAQQQAQIIAQQSLLARQNQAQAQNEALLIAQHNMAVLNHNTGPLSPNGSLKSSQFSLMPQLFSHHPLMLFPPRLPVGLPRAPVGAYPQAAHLTPGMFQMMPQVAVKRSYGDAFQEQVTPAKRPFQPQATGQLPVYQHYYPNL